MFDRILRWRIIPILPQLLTFAVFILLIRWSWEIYSISDDSMLLLRYTNLANLVVWNFWWPAVIIGAILFGRLWCTVCPMELIQNVLGRIGLKRKVPRWMRSGWLITALFAAILLLGTHTWSIRQVPHQMALYLTSLLGLTVVFALVFEKRAFCSHACPVGFLLGICASASATELRVKDQAVCEGCREKPCINASREKKWFGRTCQSNLYPANLADNRDCILCTQCAKACPNDNVTFRFRWPGKDLARGFKLKPAEQAFMLLIIGHAFLGIIGEWNISSAWVHAPFVAVNNFFSIPAPWDGTVNGLWFLVILPGLFIWAMSALSNRLDGGRLSLERAGEALYAFIPLTLGAFLAKGIYTPLSRLQNLPHAIKDPIGWDTAHYAAVGMTKIGGDWQLVTSDWARIVSAAVLFAGFLFTALLIARLPRRSGAAWSPILLVAVVFFAIAFGSLIGATIESNDLFIEPYNPCGAF